MSATDLLTQNAEGTDIAYWLFGSRTRNLADTYKVTRDAFAATLDEHGFTKVAEWIRDVDYVRVTNEVASRRGKPLANQVARRTTDPSGRPVVITVRPITAAEKATAYEVVRGVQSATEECGTENDRIGARVVANGSGVYALPPHPDDGGQLAQDDACMEVARQIAQEAFNAVGYVTSTDVSKAFSRCYDDAGTYSNFLCEGAKLGIAGRDGTSRLLALAATIKDRHYNGFSGIRLNAVGVPRNPHNDESWGDALLQCLADDAAELAKKLKAEAKSGKTRASTIATRQGQAQELLDAIKANQAMLGEWGSVLQRQADAIHESYQKAVQGMTLELPEAFDDLSPDAAPAATTEDTGAPEGGSPPPPPSPDAPPVPEGASSDPDLSAFDI